MTEAINELISLAGELFVRSLSDYVGMHLFAFVACLVASMLGVVVAIVVTKHRPKEIENAGRTIKLDWDDTTGHLVALLCSLGVAAICFPVSLYCLACALFPMAGFFPG